MTVHITINIFGGFPPEAYRPQKLKETFTVATQATDDQKFTQLFASADADKVPDGSALPAVTVTFADASGNDLSKWISAEQDAANPALFSYTRLPDDGTQPAQLDFIATGTITVNGVAETVASSLSFVPGAPAALTATTAVVPLAAAAVN